MIQVNPPKYGWRVKRWKVSPQRHDPKTGLSTTLWLTPSGTACTITTPTKQELANGYTVYHDPTRTLVPFSYTAVSE